jgi:hypothetical protein
VNGIRQFAAAYGSLGQLTQRQREREGMQLQCDIRMNSNEEQESLGRGKTFVTAESLEKPDTEGRKKRYIESDWHCANGESNLCHFLDTDSRTRMKGWLVPPPELLLSSWPSFSLGKEYSFSLIV